MTIETFVSRPIALTDQLVCIDPDITIRAKTPADGPFLQALFTEERRSEFAPLNLPMEMLAMLIDQQFRSQQADYAVRFPTAEMLVICRSGGPIGRLTLASETVNGRSTLHIVDIALMSSERGRGIGTDVIDAIITAADMADHDDLRLSVFAGNPAARRALRAVGVCRGVIRTACGLYRDDAIAGLSARDYRLGNPKPRR